MLIRSADLHSHQFPAGAAHRPGGLGTNNIPIDKCNERGIAVFNTPGANANAVKRAAVGRPAAGLPGICWAASSGSKRQVEEGVDVSSVVEKGKAAFVGPELIGKSLGVIGLGAIGSKVANIAIEMGMHVLGYDPTCRWIPLWP